MRCRINFLIIIFTFIAASAGCKVYAATAQPLIGNWKGMITHQGKNWEVSVDILRKADTLQALVNFLDIVAWEVPFSIKVNGNAFHISRPQPGNKFVVFEGVVENEIMQGKFTGAGAEYAPFVLKKQDPFTYVKEEMEILNDTVTLSGTLITPGKNGKYPLVIFIHGGSPDLRRVYLGPAMHFVQKGFAAFIYDKRGVGKSKKGNWQTDGIKALAGDVVAWTNKLKKHRSIDKTTISVYGHSEGGWTAPMAASVSKDIKNIIISGASGLNASQNTIYSRAEIMRKDGFSDSVIAIATAMRRQMYAATRLCYTDTTLAVKLNKDLQEKINLIHNEPWFSSSALPYLYSAGCPTRGFLDLLFNDPLITWSKIKAPVLGVWGRGDILVPVDTSFILIKNTLANSGNKNFTGLVLPGLDHSGNIIASTGEWDFPRTSKEFFEEMVIWLRKRIKKNQ